MQPSNAYPPISVIPSGIIIEERFVHPEKQYPDTDFKLEVNSANVRLIQSAKAEFPILVTLLGMTIDASLLNP